MAYQVLARKWRPQDFSSIVGQEPIVTALRNALTEGRIAQAYLFSGIRGVGKTTAARVMAKALNCERGPGADPCNECLSCREITSGGDLDVIEVDAATYSKVEQVRDLTESLKYGPARDRHKVVVLDEIHRLSRQAFDALLKIIEEPPPHVVFIFATTEIEAVPATILSRCQEFHFRRVPTEPLAAHLRTLADAEEITVSEAALRLIARAGEGSVRDSVALLDQLATFGSRTIEDSDAARLLGGLDPAFFETVLTAILETDPEAITSAVRDVEDRGWDPRHAFSQFLGYCRDALHLAMGGDPDRVALPSEEAARLAEIARETGYETLLRLLHHLLGSEDVVRRSEAGTLALEIAWLRAGELPKLARIEDVLAGRPPRPVATSTKPTKPTKPTKATPPPQRPEKREDPAVEREGSAEATEKNESQEKKEEPGNKEPVAEPASDATEKSADSETPARTPEPDSTHLPPHEQEVPPPDHAPDEPPPKAATAEPSDQPEPPEDPPAEAADRKPQQAGGDPPVTTGEASVERFLDEVSKLRGPLAAHLSEAQNLSYKEGVLTIVTPKDDDWLHNRLSRDRNREALEKALANVWGPGVTWTLIEGEVGAPEEPLDDKDERVAAAEAEPVADDPTVQTVLEIFGGTVQGVDPIKEE